MSQILTGQIAESRLVFIDPTVEDYQSLVMSVLPHTEVIVLDAEQDGVEQISTILAQKSAIKSLHIISHGAPGKVYVGNTQLGVQNLNSYAQQLIEWSEALSDRAQILLYGCEVAQTDLGKTFVQCLSELTRAIVLASENLTGNATLGGDWELEVRTESTIAVLAFEQTSLTKYGAILAKPYLVKDINPGSDNSRPNYRYSYPTYVDGVLYFIADDDIHGRELWKSDGTEAGTVLVKDTFISIYTPEYAPYGLTSLNDTLYFFAPVAIEEYGEYEQYNEPSSLWKSDGTEAGTIPIFQVIGTRGSYSAILLANINDNLYFSTSYEGLWKSDGTQEGTILLKEYDYGRYNTVQSLINVDSTIYFIIAIDGSPAELWKSDGTTDGTVLITGISSDDYYRSELANIDGIVYFNTEDGSNSGGLWKSDGTTAGTVLVKEIDAVNENTNVINHLTDVNGILYFIANDNTNGKELWKSDGTEAGTVLVKDINPGANGSFAIYNDLPDLTNVNGTLYFIANDGIHGRELWKSDGTEAGTVLVKDINPGATDSFASSNTSNGTVPYLTNVNGILYFIADDGIHGRELWKSDGTEAGTILVEDINPGFASSIIADLTNFDGILYFYANDGIHGHELWALNTSPSTVNPLVSIIALEANAAEAGNNPGIFRISRTGDTSTALSVKYTIDGAATNGNDYNQLTGTATITPGQSFVDIIITPENDIFKENSETVILTLYNQFNYDVDASSSTATVAIADDATTAILPQPYLVKDIYPGYTASININAKLTNLNGILYFAADDPTHGSELWKSDGTANGTVLVKDIRAGSDGSNPYPQTNFKGAIYFNASYFTINGSLAYGFWKSDGTEIGTVLFPGTGIYLGSLAQFTNVNGTLFFIAKNDELWKSDGTAVGTVLLKDIKPGFLYSNPQNLTNVNGILFFTVNGDDSYSKQLWRSNGTSSGTVKFKDISSYSSPELKNVNGILYFNENNALWKSDGTVAGTVIVKQIFASNLTNFNNILYFTGDDNIHGSELWKSDGTEAGTVLVKDINPGSIGSSGNSYYAKHYFTNVNGTLYFIADDGIHGSELWKSDGTEAGTVLVKDINPGSIGSFFNNNDPNNPNDPYNLPYFTNVEGTLYFIADNGTHGRELWKTDGTEGGTVLVKDINLGFNGSDPSQLVNINGTLYFLADDGIHGRELWALNTNTTISITATDAQSTESSNNPGIFRVTRTGDTDNVLTVKYTIGGTATNSSDYTQLTGTASFAIGQSFVDIIIKPIADGLPEGNETVILTLITQADYELDTSYTSATVRIVDDFNIINGNNGSRDPLIGTVGNDRITGGTGKKTIGGNAGDDEFIYTSIREVGHRITDFTVGSDKIVLTQLLDNLVTGGYNGSNAIADGYVKLVQGSTANSTILQIDRDGSGGAVFRPFIQLDNVTPQAMSSLNNFVF